MERLGCSDCTDWKPEVAGWILEVAWWLVASC